VVQLAAYLQISSTDSAKVLSVSQINNRIRSAAVAVSASNNQTQALPPFSITALFSTTGRTINFQSVNTASYSFKKNGRANGCVFRLRLTAMLPGGRLITELQIVERTGIFLLKIFVRIFFPR